MTGPVLVLNAGSSSLKYKLLEPRSGTVIAEGVVERIGEPHSHAPDHAAAWAVMESQLTAAGVDLSTAGIRAVGHRVVHGGPAFSEPVIIDDAVVDKITEFNSLAPLHNPPALACIAAARKELPGVPHVAVFDTAFFATLPPAAYTYAIPVDLARDHHIRKYGFHGTSHRFVSGTVTDLVGSRPGNTGHLNQIVLHLGNGCSISAIRDGIAVDTSMGLTPLQGLVMGTRSGDIDPGLHLFLHNELGLTQEETDRLLNKESGLKGLSGVNDFRTVEERMSAGDESAQLAFDVYVHRLRSYLGAYLVLLGRVDVITFTAGVGENSAILRAAVLKDLEAYGIEVDHELNNAPSRSARVISRTNRPMIMVVPTNEELAIARDALSLLPT